MYLNIRREIIKISYQNIARNFEKFCIYFDTDSVEMFFFYYIEAQNILLFKGYLC